MSSVLLALKLRFPGKKSPSLSIVGVPPSEASASRGYSFVLISSDRGSRPPTEMSVSVICALPK